jgi:ubiquinone/menaquinone biosynthesis C-methylase UbiE
MSKRVVRQSEPLGFHDTFKDATSWDDETAKQWVDALNLRAISQDQVRLRARLIELAKLRRGDTVVEVGCGTGALLCELANSVSPGGRVIGIEPQPFLAESASQRLADAGYKVNSEVRNESANQLSLKSESAAACLAQTVLIHLPDEILLQSLLEMIRVVQRGGRVLSVDQDGDTWVIDHPNRHLTRRIVRFNSDQRYADGWTGRRLRRFFRQAGLSNVEIHAWPHVDIESDSYLFSMAKRLAGAAAEVGVISESEHLDWVRQLHESALAGHFFSSINYYACVGVRV